MKYGKKLKDMDKILSKPIRMKGILIDLDEIFSKLTKVERN
jgi:hypothetical protein